MHAVVQAVLTAVVASAAQLAAIKRHLWALLELCLAWFIIL